MMSTMVRVTCPGQRENKAKCNAFLFEAEPDFAGRIVKKCSRCHSTVEVTDLNRPVVLTGYHSPNAKVFAINRGR